MPVADGVLTSAMVEIWDLVGSLSPASGELMGGTALAVHLEHRQSEDLDIFVHRPFDPLILLERLQEHGPVEADYLSEGTLNCFFENVKLQFLVATGQQRIERGRMVGEMAVGSFPDVVATKLKVVGDRGELRDYYDLMCIEVMGDTDVMAMLDWYCLRYGLSSTHQSVYHIVRALGSFNDVADDPWLSASLGKPGLLDAVAEYWQHRQPEIARVLFR
ncbi:MAG: nucleotidyl transferase AbiEii/AbiGii toxin family protein [bacterium]|nr:nucleotidyl transferase AbiEii/AbiGii toxin family protein [bacterium]